MGYDVYGKNPKNKMGEYFRANIWWWPPLWTYCEDVAPEITCKVGAPLSNEGDGLNEEDAIKLADSLDLSMLTSTAIEREEAYHQRLNSYPMKPCPFEQPSHEKCIVCNGKEEVRDVPIDAAFTIKPFEIELLKEFMTFCRYSGGFEIR